MPSKTGWLAVPGGAAEGLKSARLSVHRDFFCADEFQASKSACRETSSLHLLLDFVHSPQSVFLLNVKNKSALSLIYNADGSPTHMSQTGRENLSFVTF